MAAPIPYLHFDRVAADALGFYQTVFGGELALHTFAEFGRTDGPGDAIAHGILSGPVDLYGSDAAGDDHPVQVQGLMLSLLGFGPPDVIHGWFTALSAGGEVIDPLQQRPWGAWDGMLRDRFGLTWLLGYEVDAANP